MKASINKNIVYITGSLSEKSRIEKIIELMMGEINTLCLIEDFSRSMCEYTLSYSDDELTVATVKESYSDAKKATKI